MNDAAAGWTSLSEFALHWFPDPGALPIGFVAAMRAYMATHAAEQTAAEAAKHADCCVDREELAELRRELSLRHIVQAAYPHDPACTACALLAAPEAAP